MKPKTRKKPKLHVEKKLLSLDLACGQVPADGYEGVDLWAPEAKHKWDLLQPWPLKDNSCERLRCSHFIEHIPMTERDGQDMLLWFFDEAFRVLTPGGTFRVDWPCLQTSRAFQDPTHRRFIPQETMLYLCKNWREHPDIKLNHYPVKCDFEINVGRTMPTSEGARHVEVQGERFNNMWNVAFDFQATLKSLKK
jgi:predicted SAM-dependent methyltransferase